MYITSTQADIVSRLAVKADDKTKKTHVHSLDVLFREYSFPAFFKSLVIS